MNDLSDQITACLVVYNEEAVIERCLESLSGVTKQIVVVHDGECGDRTLEICRAHGCEIHVRTHVGMCEGHRVFTFEQAKTPWILMIDADEFLSKELRNALPELVKDQNVAAYEFIWPYWDGRRQWSSSWPVKRALFRTDSIQYLAFPHAEVEASGEIRQVPLTLEHRPRYDNFSLASFREKHKKWIGIHASYFVRDWSTIERFPSDRKDLKPHYSFLRDWPRVAAPFLFCYHFAGLMLLGGWKAGLIGLRNAWFQALYYYKVALEVSRQKNNYI